MKKNYCNRTLTVKVIVENVVTCFLGGHSVLCRPKAVKVQTETTLQVGEKPINQSGFR